MLTKTFMISLIAGILSEIVINLVKAYDKGSLGALFVGISEKPLHNIISGLILFLLARSTTREVGARIDAIGGYLIGRGVGSQILETLATYEAKKAEGG